MRPVTWLSRLYLLSLIVTLAAAAQLSTDPNQQNGRLMRREQKMRLMQRAAKVKSTSDQENQSKLNEAATAQLFTDGTVEDQELQRSMKLAEAARLSADADQEMQTGRFDNPELGQNPDLVGEIDGVDTVQSRMRLPVWVRSCLRLWSSS